VNLSHELETAKTIARMAASVCQMIQAELVDPAQKGGREPVTIADYASQAVIGNALAENFPDDAVLSEERSEEFMLLLSDQQRALVQRYVTDALGGYVFEEQICAWLDFGKQKTAYRTWVIDPIDGTSVFLDGLPIFCVCVGLMKRGRPYAGMLRYPATRDVYEAVRGHGAFYNGVRIKIDAKTQLRHEAPIYVPPKIHYKYRITYRGKTRNFGSTATHVALVARGVALATVGRANVWDYAAAAAILIEAGGEIKYVGGGRIDWPSLIYSRDKMPFPVIAAERSRWNEVASMVEHLDETD